MATTVTLAVHARRGLIKLLNYGDVHLVPVGSMHNLGAHRCMNRLDCDLGEINHFLELTKSLVSGCFLYLCIICVCVCVWLHPTDEDQPVRNSCAYMAQLSGVALF